MAGSIYGGVPRFGIYPKSFTHSIKTKVRYAVGVPQKTMLSAPHLQIQLLSHFAYPVYHIPSMLMDLERKHRERHGWAGV